MKFALAKSTLTAVAMTLGLLTGFGAQPASADPIFPSIDDMVYMADSTLLTATAIRYDGSGGDVVIPPTFSYDGSTYSVTNLSSAFLNYKPVTSVSLPSTITAIASRAFYGASLTSVSIPSGVTSIGESAFAHSGLASVTIPNSVATIGECAFCFSSLTSVSIPSTITSIGAYAFQGNKLTSVDIQSGVLSIGDGEFANNLLTKVTIPSSVSTIGADAFASNQLTSLSIASGVTTIGADAFQNNSLTSVTIPSSVTSIGSYAFGRNDSFSTVLFLGAAPTVTVAGSDGSFGEASGKSIQYLPANSSGFSPLWNGYDTAPAISVSGTAKVGQSLAVTTGMWAAGYTLAYSWKRAGLSSTLGAAATYTPVAADIGKTLTVTVTATRDGFTPLSIRSAVTTAVIGQSFTTAPTPTITGTKVSGSLLTAVTTGWVPSSGVTFTYVWKRASSATGAATTIGGATGRTYRLTTADRGKYITVTVTAIATGYVSTTKTSASGATLIAR